MSWIGVDLDGTLAKHDSKEFHPLKVGEPIWPMVTRIQKWIARGIEVRIFTARISGLSRKEERDVIGAIRDWLVNETGLQPLAVTCQKDYAMVELWDDRAIRVEFNTGRVCQGCEKRAEENGTL